MLKIIPSKIQKLIDQILGLYRYRSNKARDILVGRCFIYDKYIKIGRDLIYSDKQDVQMEVVAVRLTGWHKKKARRISAKMECDRNLSVGIRMAIEKYEEGK